MSTPAVVRITNNSGPAVVRILPPGAGVALSDATPQSLGTAAAGTGTAASRSDHRHAMPSAADVGAAAKANNLSDLLDFDAARTNIGAARAGIVNFSGITASGLVLAGRYSTGVGGLQEINLGTGLSFTGSVLNAFDRANPSAIGGTTAAAGSFTALSASTSLLLPNTAGTAAGHAYCSGDTIRYRDSSNVERLLLNNADNLANLGNTATARSNLGIGTLPFGALVGTTDTQTLTSKTLGNVKETVYTITDAAGFAIDPANGPIQVVTLGANRTPVATNFIAGQSMLLCVDDGTGFAITWTSVGTFISGTTAPILATTGYTLFELFKIGSVVNIAYVGTGS